MTGVEQQKSKKLKGKLAVKHLSMMQEKKNLGFMSWWCYPTPFREMGARRNSSETQQSGHTPWSDQRSKWKK